MPRFQVAFRAAPFNTAVVQMYGDALPANHINIGSFYHEHEDDEIANQSGPENHVIYQHVRELLYKRKPDGTAGGMFPNNITDMAAITISLDAVYTAVSGISSLPATVELDLSAGGTQQITNTVSPGGASNPAVTYATSNAAVATVSPTGLVTATGEGTATITVTTVDGGFTDTCVVTVVIPVVGISTLPATVELDLSELDTQQMVNTFDPVSPTNTAVTYDTSDALVATVSVDGLITAVGVGTATITVTTDDGSFTDTCVVTVVA